MFPSWSSWYEPSTDSSFLRSARSPAAGPEMPGTTPGTAQCCCLQGISCAPSTRSCRWVHLSSTWSCKSSDPVCLGALQALDSAHTCKPSAPAKSPSDCSSVHREPGSPQDGDFSSSAPTLSPASGQQHTQPRDIGSAAIQRSPPGRASPRTCPWQPLVWCIGQICPAQGKAAPL